MSGASNVKAVTAGVLDTLMLEANGKVLATALTLNLESITLSHLSG